ncbi:Uncharacterised protein [uncultured archaeon]|nr:Uncharacterised protein [uncultured archaeon]
MYSLYHSILSSGSVILALIGLYFVIRIWMKWKNLDRDLLKARVFLNINFLEKNWLLVFLSGASLTIHQSLEFLNSSNYFISDWLETLSEILEFMALVFLIILAYEWFKFIMPNKKNCLSNNYHHCCENFRLAE